MPRKNNNDKKWMTWNTEKKQKEREKKRKENGIDMPAERRGPGDPLKIPSFKKKKKKKLDMLNKDFSP